MSAANTDAAPSALVAIVRAVKLGSAAPLFSYQAILSSLALADIISISPSLSKSFAYTE